ncbi:Flp pilus assembly protein CpaB [Nocardioides sp. GY 10113]|uniref:Flp pilus assembly protein CpaB n=1 Tax=Nocardioides sp. GY 10113 TaxID=2569761 RepID=UPI0010A7643F|nr:Flp pilus assembly protein CpaB [Nocardioides sp. GY 10113]TIC88682.1 Flp pilus assembly protein CpaB [Nocardioides sp. GY 10113]
MDRRRLLLIVAAVVAACGVSLVFVYAQGADARAAEKYDTVEVLTAAERILPGESLDDALEAGKVVLSEVAQGQVLADASSSADGLSGTVALTTVYPGEQLIPLKFGGADEVEAAASLPIPDGKLAISIAVEDAARVGDFIRPGAEVTVFLTRPALSTRLLLDRVTVLAFGTATTVPNEGGETPEARDGLHSLLTVAVSQREAEKVRYAESIGSLSVALLNDGSKTEPDEGVDDANLFD